MRLFNRRHHSRKSRAQSNTRLEALEARLYLTCNLQQLSDGTLLITGDDAAQTVDIVDQGHGNVSVRCRERAGDRVGPRLFSGVTAITANLNGGNDILNYSSVQDVNAALPVLNVLMGAGNDRAQVDVVMRGTPVRPRGFVFNLDGGAGDDSLRTNITSLHDVGDPTQPVLTGMMEGGAGRDELSLISSTSSGGFQLTSTQRNPSTGGTTTTDPDCLIWDLIDGTTGQVDAQVMGSSGDDLVVLRSDARGLGRRGANFAIDTLGGNDRVVIDVVAASSLQFAVDMGRGIDDVRVDVVTVADDVFVDGQIITAENYDPAVARSSLKARLDVRGDRNQVNFNVTGVPDVDVNLGVTGADTSVHVGMLLPAIQKVRDAAAKVEVLSSGAGNTIDVHAEGFPRADFKLAAPVEPVNVVTLEYLVLGTFLALDASSFRGKIAMNGSEGPEGSSLHLKDVELSGDMIVSVEGARGFARAIRGMQINDGGRYEESIGIARNAQTTNRPVADGLSNTFMVGENIAISRLGSFVSRVIGGRDSDRVTARMDRVLNRGQLQQSIDTKEGADIVIQSINGFENYGTATFVTELGGGADHATAICYGVSVLANSSFSMVINGGAGQDVIRADVQVTVDGVYRFAASGGRGNDEIAVRHEIVSSPRPNNRSRQSSRIPSATIEVEGNAGDDLIAFWLSATERDDELLLNALVDGGDGVDTARTFGPVRVRNVEHHHSRGSR